MTFSIAARCTGTGRFAVAVCSSSPAVAARCIFARARVGAVCSQNITDPALGPRLLDLMALGASADEAIAVVCASTEHIDYRQLTALDAQGRGSCFSGNHTLGIHAEATAENVVCAGNLLSTIDVPAKMLSAFQASNEEAHIMDKVLSAMQAGLAAGGEAGPVHSAGLLLMDTSSWPVASLRVDWHEAASPVSQLVELWRLYEPQLNDYVTRAIDPSSAPGYDVPGDV